jgi:nucleoside-diphosphate-sugar epimerase
VKVLVTGGTGFVGAWTARAIVDAGHQVRYLVRTPDKLGPTAGALGLDTTDHVVGDITDADSVREALGGCDAVVHCAAVVAIGPDAAERMSRTNLAGARNVLGQAVELGLDPVVHVSSLAAVFEPDLSLLTADLPVAGGLDGYGVSKAEVEVYVRGLQEQGAPVVITYPGMVLGPPAGSQAGEATEGVEKGARMRLIPGRAAAWTVCDVRDLGRVHAAVLEPGRGPRRYAAGGVRIDAHEIAELLTDATGRRMVHLPVPDALLRGFGRVQDRLHLGTPMTAARMDYYTRMPEADNGPVERELGVRFRSPRETLHDAVAGLRRLDRL